MNPEASHGTLRNSRPDYPLPAQLWLYLVIEREKRGPFHSLPLAVPSFPLRRFHVAYIQTPGGWEGLWAKREGHTGRHRPFKLGPHFVTHSRFSSELCEFALWRSGETTMARSFKLGSYLPPIYTLHLVFPINGLQKHSTFSCSNLAKRLTLTFIDYH